MFSPNQYSCRYSRAFYLCSGQKSAFTELQKAIDRVINLLPLFRPIEPAPGQNPIGTSKAGYDGVIGPTTSGLGLTALIGAFEVRREAGTELPPTDAVVFSMRETREKERTANFAKYAVELTSYLNETAQRFPMMLETIKAKKKDREETSVFVEPPPLPLPLPMDIASKFDATRRYAQWGGGIFFGLLSVGVLWMGLRSRKVGVEADVVRRLSRDRDKGMLSGMDDYQKGQAWAQRVFQEKLDKRDLPNLGPGYTDGQRAARAVSGIADRKLFARSGRSPSVRQENPLSRKQRDFWRGVLDQANALAVQHDPYEGGELANPPKRKARSRYGKKFQEDMQVLKEGGIPQIDVNELWMIAEPRPHERAVLRLARVLSPDDVSVPWEAQVKAVDYYNKHGLIATLNEIVKQGGSLD